MFQKENGITQDYETMIGSNIKLEGTLSGKGSILIQGIIEGNIESEGDVKVEEGAVVSGTINASNVHVSGEVKGNVIAENEIVLTGSSKVDGDITAKTIQINAGAVFNGKSTMTSSQNKPNQNLEEKTSEEN